MCACINACVCKGKVWLLLPSYCQVVLIGSCLASFLLPGSGDVDFERFFFLFLSRFVKDDTLGVIPE